MVPNGSVHGGGRQGSLQVERHLQPPPPSAVRCSARHSLQQSPPQSGAVRCRASCACRTLVTISPHCAPCELMRCSVIEGLRRVLRATGEQPPGFSGPYIVLDEAARVSSSSNKLRAAECGAAIDGASKARRRCVTGSAAACVASPCAGRKADAVSCGCTGRMDGPVQLRSTRGRRYGRR
jgi:hypothetical protein